MKRKYNMISGLDSVVYPTSKFHMLLSDDNIGENGENLSIIVLSCERAEATIKMMESIKEHIKNFKGEYIIADNGSSVETIKKLKEEISKVPFECKLIEFGKNYGVAGGRNRAADYATRDWIFNLDNDIYFTMNLLPEIHDTISQFGCKFLNVPLLDYEGKKIFSNGGNIFLSDDNTNILAGCGGSFEQAECNCGDTFDRSLCTFLFGTSIMNKQAFFECGKFDEGMFIGFEDIDFSIEIFKRGYKIGCIGVAGLIHDHRITNNQNDLEYEKKRFSNKNIYESAMYFEKKRGFKVWSKNTEEWLKEKNKSFGNDENLENVVKDVKTKNNQFKKFKIALIVDVRNWAFDNIAKNLKFYLGNKYDIDIIYMNPDFEDNIVYIFYAIKDYDLAHFFWRGILNYIGSDFYKHYLSYYGIDENYFLEKYVKNKNITTAVYDHKYLSDDMISVNKNIFKYIKNYTVSSNKLMNIYKNIDYLINPTCEITDGVDLNLFTPINLKRFDDIANRKIVFGWVGNSEWKGDNDSIDVKGYNTLIKPAIDELIEEGYNVELYSANRNNKHIPHEEMGNYYNNIDVYLCASLNEGTPNPVLEAMACGIPIISTDVGIVSEAFGKKQKKYILFQRDKESLKEMIKLMLNNLNELKDLSCENLIQIKNWTWKKKSEDFDKFFDNCLKNK